MKTYGSAGKALLLLAGLLLMAGNGHAQGVIRFIASYGNDANACTRTAPCRSMQAGVNATPAGSELQVIDSAGYGQNTVINKSITISATGVTATLLTTAGTGITIAAGASDVVVLRGLTLSGAGTGSTGISVTTAGTVHIERCVIERFTTNGILYGTTGRLYIEGTTSRETSGGDGLDVTAPPGGTARINIDASRFDGNGGQGVIFNESTIEASITNSSMSNNAGDGFLMLTTGTPDSRANLAHCTAANNGNNGFRVIGDELNIEFSVARGNGLSGIVVESGTIRVSNSVSTNNAFGLRRVGGTFESRQNNTAAGNTTSDTSGTITPIGGT